MARLASAVSPTDPDLQACRKQTGSSSELMPEESETGQKELDQHAQYEATTESSIRLDQIHSHRGLGACFGGAPSEGRTTTGTTIHRLDRERRNADGIHQVVDAGQSMARSAHAVIMRIGSQCRDFTRW